MRIKEYYDGLPPSGRTIVLAVLIIAIAAGVGLALWLGKDVMPFFNWFGQTVQ